MTPGTSSFFFFFFFFELELFVFEPLFVFFFEYF